MDIKRLLENKKKELLSGINTTDPVAAAYKLGAFNLCDELLNVINPSNDKMEINDEKVRWAIKEELYSTSFNTITGDRDTIHKCISFMEECYWEDKYTLVMRAAKKLFPELKWDYVIDGEYSYEELNIEWVYSGGAGSVPVKYESEE